MNKDDFAYSLRLQSKRTDIPNDVVRSLSEAYQALQDVADAVSEMEAMLVDQRTEIKRLRHMEEVDQLLIKELLGKSEQLLKERDELRQQVENIKNGFEGGCYLCEVVGEMNNRLQKERDEARRWVCQIGAKSKEEAETMAIRRGWDCYKNQETP